LARVFVDFFATQAIITTTMALPHPEAGILRFMNNVRFSLAMDPGRQLVQDHIQFHGFSFLDDYLETVLAGPQRE
jgi:hypothetical protein